MTLDAAISKLSSASDRVRRGEDILEACIVLSDTTGRRRLQTLRTMCSTWDVARQEKVQRVWNNRSLASIDALLSNSVCLAAAENTNKNNHATSIGVDGNVNSDFGTNKTYKHKRKNSRNNNI